MTQLIDKAAVVAVIEKIRCKGDDDFSYCNGWKHALRMLEIEINNLEVKKVNSYEDLDKEIQYMYKRDDSTLKTEKQYAKYAKHFFELGIKTQKGK